MRKDSLDMTEADRDDDPRSCGEGSRLSGY